MNDFCGITDGKEGTALAGDGIMEYEVLPMRRTICLTLLRATDKLYAYAYSRGDKVKLEAAQMIGKHKFRYAYIPFEGTYEKQRESLVIRRHAGRA